MLCNSCHNANEMSFILTGDNSNSPGLVDMNCVSNGDNNNDEIFSTDLTDILRNVDFSKTVSDDLASEFSHVVNNNVAVGGCSNIISSTNISLNINEIDQSANPSSSNSGMLYSCVCKLLEF